MIELLDVRTALRRLDETVGTPCVDTDPRAAVARAIGLASAGVRTTVDLDSAGLAACVDLVAKAVERRLALVLRVAAADGHEALFAAADRGCGVLFAIDLQEAVDLSLVARRAAERALVPVVVAHDLDVDSVHDVELPGEPVRRRGVGAADDDVGTPTAEQRMVFGPRRRRLPRWFDLERPVLVGPRTSGRVRIAQRAALGPYAFTSAPALFDEAFAEVARATGRPIAAIAEHEIAGAKLLVVALGSAAAVAARVVDHLRANDRTPIGALALRALRPFPAAALVDRIRGRGELVLIERAIVGLAADPPLAREIGALMRRALESGQLGRRAHRNLTPWRIKDDPVLHVAIAGPGSRAVCSADLLAFCREVARGDGRTQAQVGVDFAPEHSALPKRQALLDRVRRDHPGLAAFGVRAVERAEIRPAGAVTADVALCDLPAAARVLHAMLGGNVRSTVERDRARVTVGPGVRTPGCDAPIDVVVTPCRTIEGVSDQLARGAAVVLACDECDAAAMPVSLAQDRYVALHRAPAGWPDARLGAMVSALHTTRAELDTRKALAAFDELCGGDADRLAAFRAGLERTHPIELGDREACCCDAAERPVPGVLLPLARPSDAHDSLARFHDHVGALVADRALDELAPDPYLAVPVLPPLSAAFGRQGERHGTMPVVDGAKCTACGACWTACPDGAVGPLALAPRAFVEAAIDRAKRDGHAVDALRMLVGKLAGALRADAGDAAGALQSAADAVIVKAAPDGERRATLDAAFAAVRDAVGALPLAAAAERDPDGTLFALAIDPNACKACGLCIAVCEPDALRSASRRDVVAASRAHWRSWEQLPDPAGNVIAALRERGALGVAAALGLSRHGLLPIAPGDDAEPGSGPRLALRLVLGAVEAHGQPAVRSQIDAVGALQDRFAERIRETLAGALPTGDLDALAQGLDALGHHDVALADLAARVGELCEGGQVDGARLDRLVRVARALADHRFALESGPQGLGRARAGVALLPGATTDWACTFPSNPFAMPAATDGLAGDAADFARGLCEGQVDAWLDGVRLLRRATLELERPSEAVHATAALRGLGWEDVAVDERAGCPPLVFVGSATDLAGTQLDGVRTLLRSSLPVVVVAIADGAHGDTPDLGLLAVAERDAFVVQGSVAAPDHLVDGVLAALRSGRPALVHVHAPSPARAGCGADGAIATARAALHSRAFPLFTFDPGRPGVFGSRLCLAGNPEAAAAAPSPLHDAVWRTLREVAGDETPFTERVRDEAERDVAARHAAELDAVRAEGATRLSDSLGGVEAELLGRLRSRLTTLALRGMR